VAITRKKINWDKVYCIVFRGQPNDPTPLDATSFRLGDVYVVDVPLAAHCQIYQSDSSRNHLFLGHEASLSMRISAEGQSVIQNKNPQLLTLRVSAKPNDGWQ
jgi:hypothetical protein